MRKHIIHIILSLLVCFQSQVAKAQANNEYGVWAGISQYLGDMNPIYTFNSARFGSGVFFRYNFSDRMALRAGINYGMIAGNDSKAKNFPYLQARNLNFSSQILEFESVYEFNFFKYIPGETKKHNFTPFIYAGAGIFYYNPTTKYQDEKYRLQEVGTEGQKDDEYEGKRYGSYTFAIPFGGGFKLNINHNWSVNIIASSRKTFSDFIDDVSGVYPDESEVNYYIEGVDIGDHLYDRSDNNLGIPGKQRGTSKDVDRFLFYGVGITYTVFQSKCPKF